MFVHILSDIFATKKVRHTYMVYGYDGNGSRKQTFAVGLVDISIIFTQKFYFA